MKNIADRWEKMHARNNRISSKLEILLQRNNFLSSSSHGAWNSSKHIPTSEPSNINLYDEFRSSAKQIEVDCRSFNEVMIHPPDRLTMKLSSVLHPSLPKPPPKPPDWSFHSVSDLIYNNGFAKETIDYSTIWTLFSGFASIDYVRVLSQISYMLQFDRHFNFYIFGIASSIYLHKLCLESHVDALPCHRNEWKSEAYCDSRCLIYLIKFYANVGMYYAQKVFAEMPKQSVVTWLTFIQGFFTSITYGWEDYTLLSLDLNIIYAFYDAFKYCVLSDSSQAWCLIKCFHECVCKMPLQYEDHYHVGLLKKLGLKVLTIASTDDLGWIHDHHLLVFSPKHTQSKLIKNVDLVQPLYFAKEAIVLVTFLINGDRLPEYYSIGSIDKAMPIMLTLTCLQTLCSNCLRLMSYSNGIVQYYQVLIIGLEEYKANLRPIIGDYIASSTVQSIRLGSFIHNYPNSNLLHNV
ncbi:unnamed protein product [Trifolium pratense]|uniref:Uncharacterized protein n=1 Tax=Trifolium pratense TaxID=57577 RepID=A0ACB0MAW2_TRIPR|nr:unnamed protein product [Trifolium pratense]